MAENENSDEIPLIEPEIPEKRNGIVFFDSLKFISMQIVESLNVHGILMILFFNFCNKSFVVSPFSRLFHTFFINDYNALYTSKQQPLCHTIYL